MLLITWNVQWCRGVDGRVDPSRIVRVCREMADFDVLCLQEVAVNYSALDGSAGEDQVTAISGVMPAYTPVFGSGLDVSAGDGRRRYFGNVILSRYPIRRAFRHLLPWPFDPAHTGMQRIALETVLDAPWGPLRVVSTHLEYYSARQRDAQVERLRELHAEASLRAVRSKDSDESERRGPYAWQPRPPSAVIVGDFNFRPEDRLHARMREPFSGAVNALRDAWQVAHPGEAHQPTLGVYDKVQWPGDPYASDFIFVTDDLGKRVVDVTVNGKTQASDHQPVLLRLRD
ncbi:MAG: endonuclease/exonuclease/phosphatase family protein [Burkholderiales bacterium]